MNLNIKNKLTVILLFTITSCFVSCSKWIDVRPSDDVYAEDAFRDKKGFESGLAGVYSSMTNKELYGADLKFGLIDFLSGYWNVGASASLNFYMANYDFTHANSKGSIAKLWSELYKVIHQVNIMYDYLDYIPQDAEKDIIKGELLGLRAYLHMEVFKLFGSVIKEEGLQSKAIPYYTSSKRRPNDFLKADIFFQTVEKDLMDAKELLKNDPIMKNGRTTEGNSSSILTYSYLMNYRGARMNIYAVRSLLARMYQLKGDQLNAAKYADEVIDELNVNTKVGINFIPESEFISANTSKDIRLSCENIFSIIKRESNVLNQTFFNPGNQVVPVYRGFLQTLYTSGSGSSSDYRLVQWGIATIFNKFLNTNDLANKAIYRNEIQLVNLSEMYFISAEANIDSNPIKSVALINKIRSHRGLSPIQYTDSQKLWSNYIDEVRREYIGEGYLYTFYKRLFLPIFRSTGTKAASFDIFKFPIPDDENIYNPN